MSIDVRHFGEESSSMSFISVADEIMLGALMNCLDRFLFYPTEGIRCGDINFKNFIGDEGTTS